MTEWIPLFQTLVWPTFVVVLIVWFRRAFTAILEVIAERIKSGASVEAGPGGFKLGTIERSLKQVQAEVATLANKTEIEQEERKFSIKVDPYKVRLRYTSERVDEKYFRVKVWLDAPKDFLAQVGKVVFERHPTFKNRFKEVTTPPFEDGFRCWGEFTIRAEITLKTGETLRRQRYLALESNQPEMGEDAAP